MHGPSRKEQYIRSVWKIATCLHDSNPTHFPPCSVSTYQKQQHFRSTQPLHPPLRTSRVIKLPRQRPRTQRHGKWATPTLTLTRAVTHMARILRAIIVRTTEAMATAMATPRAIITRTVARTLLWTQETTSPPASSPVFLQHRTWTRNVWPKLLPEYKWGGRWNIPGSGGVSQLWIS